MPAKEKALITISEARHILGVSEPTLRQWTDEGIIQAFITPGGHRRYAREELQNFLSFHQKMLGIKDLASKLEGTAPKHREIALALMQSVPGYQKLDRDTQKEFAKMGRDFLEAIIEYISKPSRKSETLTEIKSIGYQFGELTRGLDMTLSDSIQAFICHRDPIMNAMAELMKKGEAASRRFVDTIPQLNEAMDDALISLVEAYQQNKHVVEEQHQKAG